MRNRVVHTCDEARPLEACGLIAGRNGRGRKLYRCSNSSGDEHHYEISVGEVYRASLDADRYGWTLLGSWHSHPEGPDRLSDDDLAGAPDIPGWVHVLVSFADGEGTLRAFILRNDRTTREVHT
jgi:proteasome lid subunit RPN8/RPN11